MAVWREAVFGMPDIDVTPPRKIMRKTFREEAWIVASDDGFEFFRQVRIPVDRVSKLGIVGRMMDWLRGGRDYRW